MPKYTVVKNPDIYDDILEDIKWYNEKREGLGFEIIDEIENTILSLEDDALLYQIRYGNFRAVSTERFPFLVHYYILEEHKTVVIEMIASTRKNPDNWRTKL